MKTRLVLFLGIFFLFGKNSFSQEQKNKLSAEFISVNEQVELLYTIEYLAKAPLVSEHQTLIKWDIDDSLSKFSNDKAVILFKKMRKEYGFGYWRPLNWLLQYSDFPNLEKKRTALDSADLIDENGIKYLTEFRNALIDFYKKTNFHSFYLQHREFYDKLIDEVKKSRTIEKIPEYLENFYGTKLYSYNVILSPLLHQGGYNLEFKNANNQIEVYAIIGPNGEIEFNPTFDKDFLEKDLMIHEFSHSFVNPLVDKYKNQILNLETKYFNEKLKKSAKNQGYSEWTSVFDEILVRANTILITQKNYGEKDAQNLLEYEVNSGFYLIPRILEIMKEYNSNRQIYKKYEDFFPILIKKLEE